MAKDPIEIWTRIDLGTNATDVHAGLLAEGLGKLLETPLGYFYTEEHGGRVALCVIQGKTSGGVVHFAPTLEELVPCIAAYTIGFKRANALPPETMTVSEAAAAVSCAPWTILQGIASKTNPLPAEIMRGYLIKRSDLQAWNKQRFVLDGRRKAKRCKQST